MAGGWLGSNTGLDGGRLGDGQGSLCVEGLDRVRKSVMMLDACVHKTCRRVRTPGQTGYIVRTVGIAVLTPHQPPSFCAAAQSAPHPGCTCTQHVMKHHHSECRIVGQPKFD